MPITVALKLRVREVIERMEAPGTKPELVRRTILEIAELPAGFSEAGGSLELVQRSPKTPRAMEAQSVWAATIVGPEVLPIA